MARHMSTIRLRSLATGVIAVAAAVTLSACGSSGTANADLANGKDQFTKKCGSCHTMKAAGTVGVIGPNLDDAFRGSRAEGYPSSTFVSRSCREISSPGRMPTMLPPMWRCRRELAPSQES